MKTKTNNDKAMETVISQVGTTTGHHSSSAASIRACKKIEIVFGISSEWTYPRLGSVPRSKTESH